MAQQMRITMQSRLLSVAFHGAESSLQTILTSQAMLFLAQPSSLHFVRTGMETRSTLRQVVVK